MAISFASILESHINRYPLMEVRDIYKLVYQAAFGSSHFICNLSDAKKRLEEEIETMGKGPDEPVYDPVSPDGDIIRIHLRPYIINKGNKNLLLKGFIKTGENCRGDKCRLLIYWNNVLEMTENQSLPFTCQEVMEFMRDMEKQNYPAVSHSRPYRSEYSPAYRIVCRRYLPPFQVL